MVEEAYYVSFLTYIEPQFPMKSLGDRPYVPELILLYKKQQNSKADFSTSKTFK